MKNCIKLTYIILIKTVYGFNNNLIKAVKKLKDFFRANKKLKLNGTK